MLTFAGFPLQTAPVDRAFSVLSASQTGSKLRPRFCSRILNRIHFLLRFINAQSSRL
jgi:hypothetical protein